MKGIISIIFLVSICTSFAQTKGMYENVPNWTFKTRVEKKSYETYLRIKCQRAFNAEMVKLETEMEGIQILDIEACNLKNQGSRVFYEGKIYFLPVGIQ